MSFFAISYTKYTSGSAGNRYLYLSMTSGGGTPKSYRDLTQTSVSVLEGKIERKKITIADVSFDGTRRKNKNSNSTCICKPANPFPIYTNINLRSSSGHLK